MSHRTTEELLTGLEVIRAAPSETGVVELIVRRPTVGEREELAAAELSIDEGVVGDGWRHRGSKNTADGSPEVARQVTIMNARAIALFAGDRRRWALAGDQLYVDLDISEANLPPGTRLRLGDATVEISEEPHTGCAKFNERFGRDISRLVNSPEGRELRLRGLNARVIESGTVRAGDPVAKLVDESLGRDPRRAG